MLRFFIIPHAQTQSNRVSYFQVLTYSAFAKIRNILIITKSTERCIFAAIKFPTLHFKFLACQIQTHLFLFCVCILFDMNTCNFRIIVC